MQTNTDRHSQAVPAAVIETLENATDNSIAEMQPYAVALTSQERSKIPKMGDKTLAFVEKAHEYANRNPTLCPSFLNMEAFNIDFADARNLWVLRNRAKQFYDIIDDLVMLSGSEAYHWARLFYQAVKMAKEQGVPGAHAIYDELRKRFPYNPHRTSDTETDTLDSKGQVSE